ncbi:MAG: hypothetical protein ACM30G_15795 [Micromonosporaceae bacterium]
MSEFWRSLSWSIQGQAAIEQWKLKAAVVGLSPAQTGVLWNEVIADQVRWPYAFSVIREADRRLMLHCAGRERPAKPWRDAAERLLGAMGWHYTPADVDRYAETMFRMAR